VRQIMRILCFAVAVQCWVALALAAQAETVTLVVKNMTCEICPITVKKALEKVPGVHGVKVDFDKQMATITFDPDKVSPEIFVKATTEAGYPSVVGKE